ncbi:MAG: class I SAM-dependent methyltransferase [Deltaproteobacteria bacterium]
MLDDRKTSEHYHHGNLLAAVTSGLEQLGKTAENVTIEDLAPLDEFHIGGRRASKELLDQLGLSGGRHLLDIGCGLGGTARFVADLYKSRVSGIDLTAEYVETGRTLCRWTGLDDHIALHQGNALSMPFADATFDGAFMLHVGMNIPDKAGLFAEIFRVLRRDALLGIYDVMRIDEGELLYPVPWAAEAAASAVATPEQYKEALRKAGFDVTAERDRHEFAIDFFRQLKTASAAAKKPAPLGAHILMGQDAPLKAKNMIENISTGRLTPVELIARKI